MLFVAGEADCPPVACTHSGLVGVFCLGVCVRWLGTTACVCPPHVVVGGSVTPGVGDRSCLLWGMTAATPQRRHVRFTGIGSGARTSAFPLVCCCRNYSASVAVRIDCVMDSVSTRFDSDGDTCESRDSGRAQGPSDQIRWCRRVFNGTTPHSSAWFFCLVVLVVLLHNVTHRA